MGVSTRHSRLAYTNQPVLDQADFFQSDNYTRVTGLNISTVTLVVFFGNLVQPWPLVDGTTTTDSQIAAGYIYFNEVVGQPGYYSVRWRPTGVGYWRILLTYPTIPQTCSTDYDVMPALPMDTSGLTASFLRPSC